jgi:pyruvate dehydrogenase E1 component
MIPFFIYYSMFGFQRIGDLIWAAGDMRCRGFLLGATSGRTTLAGEGLQHQDGHSHLLAMPSPNLITYDPAFAFELAVIIRDGIRRMYEAQESVFYYITVYNENYPMPPMPKGAEEGILKGMYLFRPASPKKDSVQAPGNNYCRKEIDSRDRDRDRSLADTDPDTDPDTGEVRGTGLRVQLLGSGAILNEVLKAQEMLAEDYGVAADVWSVTSYKELRRDALEAERWNLLHPGHTPRVPFVTQCLGGQGGVVVAASDFVKALPDMLAKWIPQRLVSLGTDGYGRSESRRVLRDFFEVDARFVTLAALHGLAQEGTIKPEVVKKAMKDLHIDPDKRNPMNS